MPDQQQSREAPEHLIIGQIVAPFGTRGEVKATIFTEFPDRFRKLKQVTLTPFRSIPPGLAPTAALDPATIPAPPPQPGAERQERPRPPAGPAVHEMESARIHGGQMLMKLAGVASVSDAEALRGYWVMVPTAQARKLPRGSYYLYQLAGLDVVTTDHRRLGKIEEIITGAANDVYVVKGPGVTDPTGELLVPAVKQIVKRVELSRGRIVIEPPENWT